MRAPILTLASLALVALVAMACTAAATPTPTPRPQATATPTPQPTATLAPGQTPTPTSPVVATPTPTARPTATPTPQGRQPQYGGGLVQPLLEFPHLDVHQSVVTDQNMGANVYNYLIRLDEETAAVAEPDLAHSWDISADGRTITFHLHSGIQWHDGQDFSCDDVEFTFNRIMNPPPGMASPRRGALTPVQSVQCVDDVTFVVRLERAWPDALPNIADPFNVIVARHVTEPLDAEGRFLRNSMVGTGAFKLVQHIAGEGIRAERNPGYWKEGLPYLDTFEQLFITEFRTWSAGFETGRFNSLHGFDSPSLTVELEQKNQGQWTIDQHPEIIFVNFVPMAAPGSIWEDVEVRKAAALAICHDEFLEVMGDIAFVRWFQGLLPATHPYALPESEIRQVPGYGTDCAAQQAEARAIFQAKGLIGRRVELYSRGDLNAFRDSTVVMGEMLSRAGLNAVSSLMEQGPYYDMVNNKRIPQNMAVVHSIAIAGNNADAIIGQAFNPDGERNYGSYEDQYLRDLYLEQSTELDSNRRRELLHDYQRHFLNNYYHVIGGWRGTTHAWYNNIQGLGSSPNRYWPMVYEHIWIER